MSAPALNPEPQPQMRLADAAAEDPLLAEALAKLARWGEKTTTYLPDGLDVVLSRLSPTQALLFVLSLQNPQKRVEVDNEKELAARLNRSPREVRDGISSFQKSEFFEYGDRGYGKGFWFRSRIQRIGELPFNGKRTCRQRTKAEREAKPAPEPIPAAMICPIGYQCPVTQVYQIRGLVTNAPEPHELLDKTQFGTQVPSSPVASTLHTSRETSKLSCKTQVGTQVPNVPALHPGLAELKAYLEAKASIAKDYQEAFLVEKILAPLGATPVGYLLELARSAKHARKIHSAGYLTCLIDAAKGNHLAGRPLPSTADSRKPVEPPKIAPEDPKSAWATIKQSLRTRLDATAFETWLDPTRQNGSGDPRVLVIACPDDATKFCCEVDYGELAHQVARELGLEVEIRFEVQKTHA